MRLIHEYELESRDSNHLLIQKIDLFFMDANLFNFFKLSSKETTVESLTIPSQLLL